VLLYGNSTNAAFRGREEGVEHADMILDVFVVVMGAGGWVYLLTFLDGSERSAGADRLLHPDI
jgi:hypothetical protein